MKAVLSKTFHREDRPAKPTKEVEDTEVASIKASYFTFKDDSKIFILLQI